MPNDSILARAHAGQIFRHLLCFLLLLAPMLVSAADTTLLNVSFDVSRQLYQDINPVFIQRWKEKTGANLAINQSHAGSTKQARAVIEGLEADVVTLNEATDIDAIAKQSGLIPVDWRKLLPYGSAPYTSTIVFLVRKGNPKAIKDWDDLVKPGVVVVVPNPRTSGNGRYSYLAAYAFALKKFNNDDARAREFVTALFKNVPVLDSGGRGATTTFVDREIGDVLLTFESEVLLSIKELGTNKFDVVTPSLSIEAEMPVAEVRRVALKHGTDSVARAYLEFLYTEEAQDIIARNYFRPRLESVARKYDHQFSHLTLVTVDDAFGGWTRANETHFAEGGVFDQMEQANR
jgi:sulfate/thiosulfate transport system substrate-binding protein